jgi:SHS2 domain-containing protein
MASGFELRPHTADIRVLLWAETFPELFQIAVVALAEVLLPQGCQHVRRYPLRRRVELTAPDRTALLVDFLSEVLLYSQIKKALCCRVRFRHITETELAGMLYGVRVEGFVQDVKAVTYHEAEIRHLPHGYEATLVLDV